MPSRQVGQRESSSFDEATGTETTSTLESVDIVVMGVGEGSHLVLQQLRFSLNKNSVMDGLLAAGLSVREVTGITDTTTLLDTSWEERGSFIMHIYVVQTDDDVVGTIDTTEVEGTVCDLENNIVTNDTIIIS